jgi:hypothetical protein
LSSSGESVIEFDEAFMTEGQPLLPSFHSSDYSCSSDDSEKIPDGQEKVSQESKKSVIEFTPTPDLIQPSQPNCCDDELTAEEEMMFIIASANTQDPIPVLENALRIMTRFVMLAEKLRDEPQNLDNILTQMSLLRGCSFIQAFQRMRISLIHAVRIACTEVSVCSTTLLKNKSCKLSLRQQEEIPKLKLCNNKILNPGNSIVYHKLSQNWKSNSMLKIFPSDANEIITVALVTKDFCKTLRVILDDPIYGIAPATERLIELRLTELNTAVSTLSSLMRLEFSESVSQEKVNVCAKRRRLEQEEVDLF